MPPRLPPPLLSPSIPPAALAPALYCHTPLSCPPSPSPIAPPSRSHVNSTASCSYVCMHEAVKGRAGEEASVVRRCRGGGQ